jgi:hypothetical protein
MAVEVKSGAGSDLATVDSVSKAIRVTNYNSGGVEGTRELPVSLAVAPVTVVDNDIISSVDVTEYKFLSFQLTGDWVGTVTFQGSNDDGTFYDIVSQDTTSLTSPYSPSSTVVGLFKIPVIYRYFRARVTAYSSGTVTGTAYGHKEDNVLNSVGQVGTVTLAAESSKVIGTVNVATTPASATGTINAADTAVAAPGNDGVMLVGTPSVGSTVVLDLAPEDSAWAVELSGTLGGATFYFESSASSTDGVDGNWISLNGRKTGIVNSILESSTTTEGFHRGTLAGMSYFRLRAIGGVGITATVTIRVGHGEALVFLAASIPSGTNEIGGVSNVQKLGGETVTMGGGIVTAGTQRVTVATDTPVVLGAGDEAIGSVKFLPAIATDPIYHKIISATGVNATSLKGSSGNIGILHIVNGAATQRFFKLYNKASAPTVGTDVPLITITLAPASASNFTLPFGVGINFDVGIAYAILLGVADSSTTPFTVAGEVTAMIAYT